MLIDQPSLKPIRKLRLAGASGFLSSAVMAIASQFGVELPAEVAGAIVTVISFAVGYFSREEANDH